MTHEEIEAAIERLRGMKISSRDFIIDVCRAFIGGEVTGDELHYTLIELLEQADPDTHMLLPVDADGMPIHVGDVMCDEDGKPFEIDEMMTSKTNGWELFGGGYGDGFSAYDPATCRHYHKPTVSEILDELEGLRGTGDYESVVMRAAELAGMLRELMDDDDVE